MSQTLGSLAGYLDVLTFGELEVNDGEESDSNTKVEEDELWQSILSFNLQLYSQWHSFIIKRPLGWIDYIAAK